MKSVRDYVVQKRFSYLSMFLYVTTYTMFDRLLLRILYPTDLAVIVLKWAWLFGNVLDNVNLEILDLEAK